ncbi:MAG: AAA family ATPase, partial [Dehalococcoidia bacterium]|nr:AAA family ATPase [Dehalococcoidia bacterium]
MRIDSIRIHNLRSFADTQDIKLRAINVLVGVNSSGKSTFLRTFPLLRQSVETITTGPILWYGRYVDFGTFRQAVRTNSKPREITFEFGLALKENVSGRPFYFFGMRGLQILEPLDFSLSLCLGQSDEEGKTTARRISLRSPHDEIVIEAGEEANIRMIRANGVDVSENAKPMVFIPGDSLLPQIAVKPDSAVDTEQQQRQSWEGPFREILRDAFRPLLTARRVKSTTPIEIAHMLGLGSPESQLKRLKQIPYGGKVLQRNVADLCVSDPVFVSIRNAVLLESLVPLLREIDSQLTTLLRSVRYVGPIRATAERFYRQQDLAVD